MGLMLLGCLGLGTEYFAAESQRAAAEDERAQAMQAQMEARAAADRARGEAPSGLKWDADALRLGGLLQVGPAVHDPEKGTLQWKLTAQQDNVPTGPLRLLHARILDAMNQPVGKAPLEGVKGEGVLLKRGETATVTVTIPPDVRKQAPRVVIERE